jgi:glycosyltransferase involved in cell wall biosynthesis
MRILFLVSRDWTHPQATGGDACTCDYARYLAARGHQVTLLAARYPGSARQQTIEGVRIVRTGGLFFLALRGLLYYARHRSEFDLVFEEGMASVRLPFLAPLYVRKPLVAIWYQINQRIFYEQYPRPLAMLLTWAERCLLALHRRCVMLSISSDRREEIIALGFAPERVRMMPPLMLDSRPREVPSRPREPLVVWLGKIRRYKCPHHVVEAMPEVLRRVPEARLVIAGRRDDEGYEGSLLALAERLGVRDHVEVRADISDAEKWDLLARAQALVVTSPIEGFGIVIVEANRCGTPIIATEGVPSDTASDGYNCLRVPFGDRDALATALTRLLADRPLFEALSRNARQHAERFSVENIGQRLEESLAAATAPAA